MSDRAPPDQPPDQPPEPAADRPAWRGWLTPVTAVSAALLVATAGAGWAGVRVGCEAGVVDAAACGPRYAEEASAEPDVSYEAGQYTIDAAEPGAPPAVVARLPAGQFAPQFAKFVVTAPDGAATLYATATSLGMTEAKFWVVPRGGQPRLLLDLGDDLWVARPVWCQRAPGDPGRIAYVTRGPVGPDRSGLVLRSIDADGRDAREVLIGTPANGFGPALFYGGRRDPLRFLAGCDQVEYGAGAARRVVEVATGAVRAPVVLPLVPPAAPPGEPAPEPGPSAPTSPGASPAATVGLARPDASASLDERPACTLEPFAQTDPRWGDLTMRTAGTRIRSWGCALTSTAMIFRYYGIDTDPARLNACAGDQADLFHWDPVRARCAAARVRATRWSDAAGWGSLAAALTAGRPAIVGLQGGPAGSHFLVVAGGAGDQPDGYRVVDSWDGSTYKTLADYISPKRGYLLKWLIIFEGDALPDCRLLAPATTLAAGGGAGPEVGLVTVVSPADAGVYNTPQVVQYRLAAGATLVEGSHPDGATVEAEGPHTLVVTARGQAGVVRRRLNFLIDRTPPAVTARWEPAGPDAIVLTVEARDALTEVTEASYRVDDGPWTPVNAATVEATGLGLRPVTLGGLAAGRRMIQYIAVDTAGNRSAAGELALVIGPGGVSEAPPLTPTPTVTVTPTITPTPALTATPTGTPTPTITPTGTVTPTPTVTATEEPEPATPTPEPTVASPVPAAVTSEPATPGPTAAPTRAPTPEPAATPEPTAAPTREPTPEPVATPEPTAAPTRAPTEDTGTSPTKAPTREPTKAPTRGPTRAPTRSR